MNLVFDSFDILMLLSLLSVVVVFLLIRVSLGRLDLKQIKAIVAEEDGAAYSIGYMMVIPAYVIFICIVVEMGALFPAKMGAVYSAFASARTASVWATSTPWDKAEEKAVAAARRAFTPFATGVAGTPDGTISPDAAKYIAAFDDFAEYSPSTSYMLNKFNNSHNKLNVLVEKPDPITGEIVVLVEYEVHFSVPGVARLLGKKKQDGTWYLPVDGVARLQSETPLTRKTSTSNVQSLGIGYGTFE